MTGRLLSMLHFADGTFPAGGYAHSLGLETYVAEGRIDDADGLRRFLTAHLEGSAGPSDATAAAAALRALQAGDVAACARLDATLEAMKPVRALREASRQMGRQTLRVAAAVTRDERLARYHADVDAGRAPGHHGVVFGMTGGVLDWDAEATAVAYLYSATALLVGAGLRLLRIGQLEGQRVLWQLHATIVRVAADAARRDGGDLWSFGPGLELAAMRHAGLDARLFRS